MSGAAAADRDQVGRWKEKWPPRKELAAIHGDVVAIENSGTGHERFGYDHYDSEFRPLACPPDPELTKRPPYRRSLCSSG